MKDLNYQKSNVNLPTGSPGITDDYVDVLIRYIEAAALPVYQATNKMVNPPIVAMRLGPDIFIKGVVTGQVGKTFKFPILRNGRYESDNDFDFTDEVITRFDVENIMLNCPDINAQQREVLIQRFGFDGLGDKEMDVIGENIGLNE